MIETEKPMFGICHGHQLMALALGATTYKLKFGHRGANQPVQQTSTGKVEITSQNHSFAVAAESIDTSCVDLSHINLNDNTECSHCGGGHWSEVLRSYQVTDFH